MLVMHVQSFAWFFFLVFYAPGFPPVLGSDFDGFSSDPSFLRPSRLFPEPVFKLDEEALRVIHGFTEDKGRMVTPKRRIEDTEDTPISSSKKKKNLRTDDAEKEDQVSSTSEDKTEKKKEEDSTKSQLAAQKKLIPKSGSGNIVLFIAIGATAGVLILAAGGYLVYRAVKKRNRRLRYIESLRMAYVKKGDGLDAHREVLEE